MSAADLSTQDLRLALAPAVADCAGFDGWSAAAVTAAAETLGVAPQAALYVMSDKPMAMIAAFAARVDVDMAVALPADMLASLPVRERIAQALWFRLEAWAGREEALRRAQAIMAMPTNASAALRLAWQAADAMWRLAGDRATDYNHYTKRATLAAVYTACLAAYVGDTSADKAETRAFLDRRIAGVLRFEKAKARLTGRERTYFSPLRLLGRLRYPAH